jgi:hypothetical protein
LDRIENDDYSSQLRYLRLLLGKNFKPISTEMLAAMAHIPPVSIRGVEAGRRVLNDEDRVNIEFWLGAKWNPESHQWVCSWDPAGKIQFSRLEYDVYSNQLESGRTLQRSNEAGFFKALECFLNALGPKEANFAMFKVHFEMLRIARENNVDPELVEELEQYRPIQNPHTEQFPVRFAGVRKKKKAEHGPTS